MLLSGQVSYVVIRWAQSYLWAGVAFHSHWSELLMTLNEQIYVMEVKLAESESEHDH